MHLIPAIDILGGRVVRLREGRYDCVTVYHEDPVTMVEQFYAQGATRVHVVDLDGARDGLAVNRGVIERMVKRVPISVQVGGGIRSLQTAKAWMDVGVAGLVIGTMAVQAPDEAEKMSRTFPNTVIVGIDFRDKNIAVEGWRQTSSLTVDDMLMRIGGWPIWGILLTDITRDGKQEGANVAFTAHVQAQLHVPVIASGGIGTLEDVDALNQAGLRYAVCGRALYEGVFTYPEAMAMLKHRGRSEIRAFDLG